MQDKYHAVPFTYFHRINHLCMIRNMDANPQQGKDDGEAKGERREEDV